jgi:hypothetical protein
MCAHLKRFFLKSCFFSSSNEFPSGKSIHSVILIQGMLWHAKWKLLKKKTGDEIREFAKGFFLKILDFFFYPFFFRFNWFVSFCTIFGSLKKNAARFFSYLLEFKCL